MFVISQCSTVHVGRPHDTSLLLPIDDGLFPRRFASAGWQTQYDISKFSTTQMKTDKRLVPSQFRQMSIESRTQRLSLDDRQDLSSTAWEPRSHVQPQLVVEKMEQTHSQQLLHTSLENITSSIPPICSTWQHVDAWHLYLF